MKFILLNCLLFILAIDNLHANEFEDLAYKESLKAHCSVNKVIYAQCFKLSEKECIKYMEGAILECSGQNEGIPINKNNLEMVSMCIQNKFENDLVRRGIDLDKPCNTNNP